MDELVPRLTDSRLIVQTLLATVLLLSCSERGKVAMKDSDFVPETLPVPAGTRIRSVRAIRGSGPDDVWVVAYAAREDRSDREMYTQSFHFDGRAWSLVEVPARVTTVAAVSKGEAWAVGKFGTVARFGGAGWRADKLPVDWDVLDVAVDRGQVWATGSAPELYHFDGARWETQRPKILSRFRVQEVFAASGEVFVPATWQGEAGIVRYDGKEWRREVLGRGAVVKLAGTSGDDLWGLSGQSTAFHYDGKAWRAVDRGNADYVIDAWAAAPDEVWIVGDHGLVEMWNGRAWGLRASGTRAKLWAVWAAPGGPVFVGGDDGLLRLSPGSR